jgi:hypothetical protein
VTATSARPGETRGASAETDGGAGVAALPDRTK